jgi:phage portal protein BeeE
LTAWNNKNRGVNNSHKTAVLTGGLKYQGIAISQKEMEMVEQRRFTRDEILAIFKVPKSML